MVKSDEEVERAYFMQLIPQKTSRGIKKVIDEEEKILSER